MATAERWKREVWRGENRALWKGGGGRRGKLITSYIIGIFIFANMLNTPISLTAKRKKCPCHFVHPFCRPKSASTCIKWQSHRFFLYTFCSHTSLIHLPSKLFHLLNIKYHTERFFLLHKMPSLSGGVLFERNIAKALIANLLLRLKNNADFTYFFVSARHGWKGDENCQSFTFYFFFILVTRISLWFYDIPSFVTIHFDQMHVRDWIREMQKWNIF